MENQGVFMEARALLCLLLFLSIQHVWVPTDTCSIGKASNGYKSPDPEPKTDPKVLSVSATHTKTKSIDPNIENKSNSNAPTETLKLISIPLKPSQFGSIH